MDWLKDLNIYVQGLVVSAIIVAILLIVLTIVYLGKPTLSKNKIKYIYSFSSGFIIITAIVGQFVAARSKLMSHWEGANGQKEVSTSETFINMAIVLAGIIIGILIILMIKRFVEPKIDRKEHNSHSVKLNNTYENIKYETTKVPAIFMILAHRIPAGIAMGGLIVFSNQPDMHSFALVNLIAFILHIIPELLVVYYGFRDSKRSKIKSLIYSVLVKLPIIPMILLGVLLADNTVGDTSWFWLIPLLFAIVATIMIWAVVSELIPEFIHSRFKPKSINIMLIIFMAGVTSSMLIQMIHIH